MIEQWKDIPGYEGVYAVSTFGNVRRIGKIGKLSDSDMVAINTMRRSGMIYSDIAKHFGITQRAVISALTYQCKRGQHRTPHNLKGQPDSKGYPRVGLCKNGVRKTIAVHLLVARTFLGPPPLGYEVNHKNGIKSDARLDNLEYVTPIQNIHHARDVLKVRRGILLGEKCVLSKLTEKDVRQIRKLHSEGVKQITIAAQFGVTRDCIYRVIKGINWSHVA